MRISGLVYFLTAGIPGFLIAFPLNIFLVKMIGLGIEISYLLVLLVQVSINFVICRAFVFNVKDPANILVQYIQFLLGILVFRFFDWLLYVLVVRLTNIHYLIVQVSNIVIFSVLKYKFAKRIME